MIEQSLGEIDGAIQYNGILEECRKKKVDGASQLSLEESISTRAKRRRSSEKVRIQTLYCYQKVLLSTSTTTGMQVKWIPQSEMD